MRKKNDDGGIAPQIYYNAIGPYLKTAFGCRIMKLSVDGGFTCPNRDGTAGTGGCVFCSESGSGDFAGTARQSITSQLESQITLLKNKWPEGKYIAYFQKFTNTYGNICHMREIFEEALKYPGVVGLAIATRPDCIGNDVLELLCELNGRTFLWVELGLQTIHPESADFINRCYPLSAFDDAMKRLSDRSIRTVVHLILGLPGETANDMVESAKYAASKDIFGIKLHLLHILKNTPLGDAYEKSVLSGNAAGIRTLEMDEYISIAADILECLPADVTIHRLTGDGPKNLLLAPLWSLDKKSVLNGIVRELKRRNSFQGAKSEV